MAHPFSEKATLKETINKVSSGGSQTGWMWWWCTVGVSRIGSAAVHAHQETSSCVKEVNQNTRFVFKLKRFITGTTHGLESSAKCSSVF